MNFCYYRLGPNGKPRWRPLYGISDCSVFRSITELRFKNEKMNFQFNAGGEGKLRHLIKCLIKDWPKNYKHVELEGRHLLGFKAGCRGEGKRWVLVTNILAGGQC